MAIDTTSLAALTDEIGRIKEAGIGNFLRGGVQGFRNLIGGKGLSTAAKNVGGHGQLLHRIYSKGAANGGGMWGGLKSIGKSRYGQMAGTAALGAGGLYAGSKMIGSRQQQQGY